MHDDRKQCYFYEAFFPCTQPIYILLGSNMSVILLSVRIYQTIWVILPSWLAKKGNTMVMDVVSFLTSTRARRILRMILSDGEYSRYFDLINVGIDNSVSGGYSSIYHMNYQSYKLTLFCYLILCSLCGLLQRQLPLLVGCIDVNSHEIESYGAPSSLAFCYSSLKDQLDPMK